MYEFLRGRVGELGRGHLVLDGDSIGWYLHASRQSLGRLQQGDEVRLWVHLQVSDSAHTLYGFHSRSERALFRRLLQVSGVGPSLALALLSALPPETLARHILDRDLDALTAIKGVGRKTAERLMVELGDHLSEWAAPAGATSPENGQDELLAVLQGLGMGAREARRAATAARESLGTEADFQDLLRHALHSPQSSP